MFRDWQGVRTETEWVHVFSMKNASTIVNVLGYPSIVAVSFGLDFLLTLPNRPQSYAIGQDAAAAPLLCMFLGQRWSHKLLGVHSRRVFMTPSKAACLRVT